VERKLATVLFADRVGSTAAADGEDPERTRAVQDRFFDAMATEIERTGGTVEKFVGDAVVAAFGAPASQEDHAERALYAAIAMLGQASELFEGGVGLRIGVNTGEVVVGPAREGGSFVTGDTVNVAARLEQAAAPGEVLVGTRTAAAAQGAFEFGEPMTVEAKGKPGGIACRPLVQPISPVRQRGVRGVRGVSPTFVGRQGELALLEATYDRTVQDRTPHLLTTMGAPGIGKTRLLREFWERLGLRAPEPLRRIGRCLPYGSGITYWPLGEVLKEHFGVLENDRQEQIQIRLGDERVLGLTLGLEVKGLPPIAAHEALHGAWTHFLNELTAHQPVVILIEDLHWGEELLLDTLERFLGEVDGPLLLLGTARPELQARRPAWCRVQDGVSLVRLEPLGVTEVDQMLSATMHGLPGAVRDLVVDRAEGNPFFVEELLATLIDQRVLEPVGDGWKAHDLPNRFPVPDSLQALLAARIDLLDPLEKEALQAGALIGRNFSSGAVRELVAGREPDLAVLEERDFVHRRAGSSVAEGQEYAIKHALTREVAYAAIPKARRARLHATFAEWLERTGMGRDEHAVLLAHHFLEAVRPEDVDLAWRQEDDELLRMREKAVRWQRRSAELAVARGELSETPTLVGLALEVLEYLPRTPQRGADELALQMLLGLSFSATRGYAAPEAGTAYARARELCQQAEDAPLLFPVLFGLWVFYLVRGELGTARQLADRLLALARSAEDPALTLEVENMLGATLYFQGEPGEAQEHLGVAFSLYDPEIHHAHAFEYGQDPGAFSLANGALAEAMLGFDDESVRSSDNAIQLARRLNHSYTLVFALVLGAVLAQFRGDTRTTAERAQEAHKHAREHGFMQLAAWATVLLGWVAADQGRPREGAAMMREGIEACHTMGAELVQPYFIGLLAETYRGTSDAPQGIDLLENALHECERRGEHLWEADLLRLRGKLQLSVGQDGEAQLSFQRGCEVAVQQGARLFQERLETEIDAAVRAASPGAGGV
jgi:class 3 adenylate cyclase/predicted ATPase